MLVVSVRVPLDSARRWYRGRWLDALDAVNQGLEAIAVDIDVCPRTFYQTASSKVTTRVTTRESRRMRIGLLLGRELVVPGTPPRKRRRRKQNNERSNRRGGGGLRAVALVFSASGTVRVPTTTPLPPAPPYPLRRMASSVGMSGFVPIRNGCVRFGRGDATPFRELACLSYADCRVSRESSHGDREGGRGWGSRGWGGRRGSGDGEGGTTAR